jgi:protein-disulfide isomerase/uncharacterized membrane protein
MPFSPTRHRIALIIALVGMAFAIFTEVVHQQMGTGSALGRLCDLGGVVKCDMVIGSRWGQFLGLPVAVWGVGAFALGAALALPGALGGPSPPLADLGLVALSSWSVGFSAVLAVIMLGVIGYVCVFCLTMDAIILSWFVAVVPLARGVGRGGLVAAGAGFLAVASGTFSATRGPAVVNSVDEIRAHDPKFYERYTKLPVREVAQVLGDARHTKGDPAAAVTIVEFSDFECPACGQAFEQVRSFLHDRTDVRFVFRHFPLDPSCNPMVKQRLHPDACTAAVAAECAGAQGKFWPYHDQLFTHQLELDRDSLFRYAREVGLDIAGFRACLDDPTTLARVKDDITSGTRAEIQSTPTFFINGRQVDGILDPPYLDWALMIERQAAAR